MIPEPNRVFGQDYYCVRLLARQQVDLFELVRNYNYDPSLRDVTREHVSEPVLEWLEDMMGPQGTYKEPGHRWYLHDGAVWFRDEGDYLLYLLRWV